jgi:hypothetical protein
MAIESFYLVEHSPILLLAHVPPAERYSSVDQGSVSSVRANH